MQDFASPKKPKNLWKLRVLAASVSLMGIVMAASATTINLNETIGPILDSVVELIPGIIGLVVALVPAIIVMAVIGFIIGFLDKILSLLKF